MKYLNERIVRWVKRKHKHFKGERSKLGKARDWLAKVATHQPDLFVHWTYEYAPYPRKNN